MKIPIQNIYYLLCYAWDKLEEGRKVAVSGADYNDSINLLTRVLINGTKQLLKRGLDRNYNETTQEYVGIKGKIDFKESLNKNLFRQGRAICRFDSFEADILSNQVIKATLLRLTKVQGLDKEVKHETWNYYWKLNGIRDIQLNPSLFASIRLHKNNAFYDFVLKVCRLIIENTVLDQRTGNYHFKEFVGSDKAMASLFESFIRNFYKKEQKQFTVRREDIHWEATPINNSTYDYLPKMQTDITLESNERKIIIETKYYANALSSRFEVEKFNSANMYQLYSYLRNIELKTSHAMNSICEGVLLYPSVNYSLNEAFKMGEHVLKVKTVDLNKSWKMIEQDLLSIIK